MTNLELIETHDYDTGICSFPHHMISISTTYKEIIEKGMDIVPDILEYLKQKGGGMNIMLLLWDITKISPYQPKRIEGTKMASYNVKEATDAWIKWGEENNYFK